MSSNNKHPSQYWTEYQAKHYPHVPSRTAKQERKAFHEGISAALDYLVKLDGKTSKEIAEDLNWFHRHNQATLKSLSRKKN